jgi:hypothetical protein
VGARWSVIAKKLPNRTVEQIKSHWHLVLHRRWAGVQRDTATYLRVAEQLRTGDPPVKRSERTEKVWVLSAKIGIKTRFKFRLFEAHQSCIQCN